MVCSGQPINGAGRTPKSALLALSKMALPHAGGAPALQRIHGRQSPASQGPDDVTLGGSGSSALARLGEEGGEET